MNETDNTIPEFSAVIVAYNSEEHIGSTVRSIEGVMGEGALEVVVVDNASTDATADAAEAAVQNGRVVRLTDNVGYGRGANEGLKHARGRYVIVMNDDVSTDRESIEAMQAALKQGSVWLAAPALVDPDGTRQVGGRRYLPGIRDEMARIGDFVRREPTRVSLPNEGPPVEVEFVLAAFLMAERELLLRIGGFSDAFFMLGEDIDLCRRVKSLGGTIVFVPEAAARHDQSLAQDRRVRGHEFSERMLAARDTYYRIWLPGWERSAVNLMRAFGVSDQPYRFRYHFPKVWSNGPSLKSHRSPEPLRGLSE